MTAPTTATPRVNLLGPLTVEREGAPVELGGAKQRAVLAMLLTSPGSVVSRDRILQGVWGEEASEDNRGSFHTYLSNLRGILGDVIAREGVGYRLDLPRGNVDAVLFEEAVEDARSLLAADPAGAADRLREMLALWRGMPYADLVDVPGLQAEIRRLEELRLSAVELRIDADLAAGRHDLVVGEVEALAEEHPVRERFRAQHMMALYRSGRQAEALRAYRRSEAFLGELGLHPSGELRDLELKILQQDPELAVGVVRATTQSFAFLVTDIEGSARAWDRNPQAMAEALATHDRILEEAVEEAGGRVFKHTGDGVLAVFGDVSSAVAAAEACQRALGAADWGEVGDLRVRMGVDLGEAEARGGDFFGPPLNRAARLCAVGHGGQVLVSAAAQGEIVAVAPAGMQLRQLGEHRLRGLATPERVAQLVFVGLPAEFPDLRSDAELALEDRPSVASLPGYEVRERIGEGAFGVVYRAYQPSVGREVAVKVIRPALAGRPGFVRRFEGEARTIARLAHPHIVPLIDFWRDPEGAYLVLQLLPGGSLQDALAAGGVDEAASRRILHQVGEALDHAHIEGVAHGDLQPANVLLDGSGHAYLSDFGIPARLIGPEMVASLTSAPSYRAPEEADTGPTAAADLFALGTLARHLLGERVEAAEALARATAPNPTDRYPSAAAFLADLDEALGEEPSEVEHPAVSRNPYKGLRAFEEPDAADFYGRDELVATLLAAMEAHRFVTVVGPSGSGKSSAVQAGLLPVLAAGAIQGSDQWLRIVLTPGPRPLEALADALDAVASERVDLQGFLETGDLAGAAERLVGDTDGDLVLVIDQFEELFTLVDDSQDRQAFIDLLVDAVHRPQTRVRVVVTLRADFYDRPLAHDGLDRLVRDGLVTVLRPTSDELLEMVSRPAQAVGLRWEPGVPHRIVQDVADQPGGLPLLQYALTELVERRRGDLLTHDDYKRIGGVAGALSARADAVFEEFDTTRQKAARQILLRLVTVDEDTDATRRRVRRSELESLAIDRTDLGSVLDAFTAERHLLADRDPVTRGPTIEVAHEALLWAWPRLQGWIDDQREALLLGRRLRTAISDWETSQRDTGYLLTGSRLAPFLGWAETASLTADERDFLQVSKEKEETERTARARRRRTLIGVLSTATLIALILATAAIIQSRRATSETERAIAAEELAEAAADRANVEADIARSRALAASAISVLEDDPSTSKLLALAAADIADPPLEVISVLHQAYAADAVIGRFALPEGSHWTDLHPSGHLLVASGATPFDSAEHLEVADLTSGEILWSYEVEHEAMSVGPAYFSPDGEWVVAGVYWEPTDEAATAEDFRHLLGAHIWDAETGELVDRFDLGRCGGIVVDVSDTHLLVRTRSDTIEACWALPNPFDAPAFEVGIEVVDIVSGEREALSSRAALFWDNIASLSGDGRYVAFEDLTTDPPTAVVVELETGERVLEYDPLSTGAVNSALRALNRDGSLLLEGSRPTQVWDVALGEVIASFDIGLSPFAVFDPSGTTIFTTDRDGAVRQWDATTGEEVWAVKGVGSGRVSVNDQGLVLVSDPEAGVAALLDSGVRGEVGAVETCHGGWFPAAAQSLNVASGLAVFHGACADTTEPFTAHVIDLDGSTLLRTIPGVEGQVIRLSPDGSRLVSQDSTDGLTGVITVRDVRSGEKLVELEGLCWWRGSSETDLGRREETGDCRAFPEPPFPIWAWHLEWSPDARMIAAVDDWAGEGYLAVWDASTGRLLFTGEPSGFMTFTPDSEGLVMSPFGERKLIMLSTETWEVVQEIALDPSPEGSDTIGLVGYVDNGETLLAVGGFFGDGGGALHWFDAETFERVRSKTRIHEGSPKSMALSPDHSLIATGASDGLIRVWDTQSGSLVHEIPLGNTEVQGVAFVNDRHLAVTPKEGNLLVFTIDVDELLEIVRSSLTRGFTPTECERYNFGDDCPSLEELSRG